jgi:hypothetical protein
MSDSLDLGYKGIVTFYIFLSEQRSIELFAVRLEVQV